MPIVSMYQVQGPCGMWVSHDSYPKPAVQDPNASPAFPSRIDAETHALGRGWTLYPLLCPQCADAAKRRARKETNR